jgi:hypothetical protein
MAKIIDPIGAPRKERRRYGFWLSSDENDWLKKQLEIYRAQQVLKKKTSGGPNETGDNHE